MSGRHFVVQTPAIPPLPRTGAEDSDPYQKQETTEAGGLRRSNDTLYAGQNFDAVQLAEETRNEVFNPSFAVDASEWGLGEGSALIVRSEAEGFFDGASGLITATGPLGRHTVDPDTGWAIGAGETWTYSVLAHPSIDDWLVIQERGDAATHQAFFDVTNGVIGTTLNCTATITPEGADGWYRCTITFTATNAIGAAQLRLGPTPADGTVTYTPAGTPEAVFIDGVQPEKKSYATPICMGSLDGCDWVGAANGSASTRAAATVQLDNGDGLLNATLGGCVANFRALKDSTDPGNGYLMLRRQDAANLMAVYYDALGGRFVLQSRVDGVDDEAAVTAAFSRGDDIFIHPGWTDGVLRLRVRVSSGIGGTDFDSGRVARVQGVPTITNTVIHVGSYAFTQYQEAALALSNIVGYWGMGAAASPEPDLSGNGNDAVVTIGAGTFDAPPLDAGGDGAVDADGADTKGTITDDPAIQDIFDGPDGGSLLFMFNARSDGEGNNGRVFEFRGSTLLAVTTETGPNIRLRFFADFDVTDGIWDTDVDIPKDTLIVGGLNYRSSAITNVPVILLWDGSALSARTITENTAPVGTRVSDVGTDKLIANNAGSTRSFDGILDEIGLRKGSPTTLSELTELVNLALGPGSPNINLDYFVTLTRPLTDAEMRDYQTLVRPPWAGQVTGAPIVTACLRGEDEAA